MKSRVGFYPYTPNGISYIVKMQCILQKWFDVIDYMYLRNGIVDVLDVDILYLNWIEDVLIDDDKEILKKAKKLGVKIIWVFHNKKTHDSIDSERENNNISFVAKIADTIVIHSKNSGNELAEICLCQYDDISDKLQYIPHLNYIGDYYSFRYIHNNNFNLTSEERFTFAFVGAIRPYKNIETLINAYNRIKDQIKSNLIVAGKPKSNAYAKHIQELCSDDSITVVPHYIGSLEIAGLLNIADILVFPFDLSSSMNSGSIIMSFSYGKTVIVPDISMADDFPDDLLFKYHYDSEDEHINVLSSKMLDAYRLGKNELNRRGHALLDIVTRENSIEIVEKLLLRILNYGE